MRSAHAHRPSAKVPGGRSVPARNGSAVVATARIRVLIADDQTISRSGLRALLETQPDLAVVGDAADGAEAIRLTHEHQPDIVIGVLPMGGVASADAIRRLTAECPTVRMILLTPALDASDTAKALQIGVRGVVLKDTPTHLLFKSIRCVFGGQVWLGREAISDVLRAVPSLNGHQLQKPAGHNLTPREREVLTLVVSGHANRDVARSLSIGEDTVKHHLTSIFDKTGASNRLELALFAIHHQLVASP